MGMPRTFFCCLRAVRPSRIPPAMPTAPVTAGTPMRATTPRAPLSALEEPFRGVPEACVVLAPLPLLALLLVAALRLRFEVLRLRFDVLPLRFDVPRFEVLRFDALLRFEVPRLDAPPLLRLAPLLPLLPPLRLAPLLRLLPL